MDDVTTTTTTEFPHRPSHAHPQQKALWPFHMGATRPEMRAAEADRSAFSSWGSGACQQARTQGARAKETSSSAMPRKR